MSKVIHKKFEQVQCGKHIGDTKVKFIWTFAIDNNQYTLELINSMLSGKKSVLLNHQEIYSEKNIFNINFDFIHELDGHVLRVCKDKQKMNNFKLRIDNHEFEELTLGLAYTKENQTKQKNKNHSQYDPFADFSSVANQKKKTSSNSNEFGDFTFDDFAKSTNIVKEIKKPQQQVNFFDQDAFATKSPNNFAVNFQKNEVDLISEDNFATNTYNLNNNYIGFKQNNQANSQNWSQFTFQQPKKQSSINAKTVMNKIKMTAQEIGRKVHSVPQSLI